MKVKVAGDLPEVQVRDDGPGWPLAGGVLSTALADELRVGSKGGGELRLSPRALGWAPR